MSFARLIEGDHSQADPTDPSAPRELVLATLEKRKVVDVVVYGGTIEAATLARLCALSGLRVVLFCRGEYGAGSDLSQQRFALELLGLLASGQLRAVKRGLKELLDVAPQFFDWSETRLDLKHGRAWVWLARRFIPKLRSSTTHKLRAPLFDAKRFLASAVLAARQEGVLCLEHARISSLRRLPDGVLLLDWGDETSTSTGSLRAGVLFDAAAPPVNTSAAKIGVLESAGQEFTLVRPEMLSTAKNLQVSENGAVRLGSCALVLLFEYTRNILAQALARSGASQKPAELAGRRLPG